MNIASKRFLKDFNFSDGARGREQDEELRGLRLCAPVRKATRLAPATLGGLEMFQNLIESESHAPELKRRSKFMLGVMALYGLLVLAGGVASIYAYDAHLEDQQTTLELLSYVPPNTTPDEAVRPNRPNTPKSANNPTDAPRQPTRNTFVDQVDNPRNAPPNPGTTPSAAPPIISDAVSGKVNYDPPGGSPAGVPGIG